MDTGCLCKECYENLVNVLLDESELNLDTDRVHISSQTPCIELPYKHKNGNEYWVDIEAEANYCCQCGIEL